VDRAWERVGLALAAGMLALSFALVVTPWGAPDEPQHYEYVAALARLKRVPGREDISLETQARLVESMASHDYWRLGQLPRRTWGYAPTQLDRPPLPYLLYLPAYLASAAADPAARLAWMRLVSVALTALTVWVLARVAGDLFPDDPLLRLGPPLLAALTPQVAFVGGSLNSDNLANLVGAATFLALVRAVRPGASWGPWLLVAALLLVGVATKRTTLYLVPLALGAGAALLAQRYLIRREASPASLLPLGEGQDEGVTPPRRGSSNRGVLGAHPRGLRPGLRPPVSVPGAPFGRCAPCPLDPDRGFAPGPRPGATFGRCGSLSPGPPSGDTPGPGRASLHPCPGSRPRPVGHVRIRASHGVVLLGAGAPLALVGALGSPIGAARWVLDRWVANESLALNLRLFVWPGRDWSLPTLWGTYTHMARALFESYWARFGWMNVPLAPWLYVALMAGCALPLLGLGARLARPSRLPLDAWQRRALWLALCAAPLALLPIALQYSLVFAPGSLPQGRYLFPALAPIGLLGSIGLASLVPRGWRGAAVGALALALVLLDVVSLVGHAWPAYHSAS
jgi:hypothetical protein